VSAALPDPLEYSADALSSAGALVERDAEGLLAVLPDDLARELGVAEECRLVARAPEAPREDLLVCGLGAPALERLATRSEGATAVAAARLEVEPPRPRQARALAERFAVRNAPSEPIEVGANLASYLVCWLAWSAEADDRYDGVVRASVCLDDLGAPDPGLLELADPLRDPSRFHEAPLAVEPPALRRALALAAARAERGLEAPLAAVRSLVARRLRRDHERIAEYFEGLARDARASRRRVEPAAIEAKLAHLRLERDAKLRALGERYRLRVALAPIALLRIEVPALEVRLRVRRRKLAGELRVRLAPGASALDQLACDACPGTTAQPVVCDERLHVLCEVCAPSAQGRPSCGACRAPA
jgi:hypothetical protein